MRMESANGLALVRLEWNLWIRALVQVAACLYVSVDLGGASCEVPTSDRTWKALSPFSDATDIIMVT